MNSFAPGFLENLPLGLTLFQTVRRLGEWKGKQELYKQQSPQVLETLRQVAMIQSTESSNRIEGVTAPPERIRELVAEKTTPRNRSEQEIAGYRDVLSTIRARRGQLRFNSETVLQLYRDLHQFVPDGPSYWKSVDNVIIERMPDGTEFIRFRPVPAEQTPKAMDQLHERFNAVWQEGKIEPLVLIPTYVLDFLCIHPFSDGNGRMARLLTLLLLYRAGYEVGRFISLEKIVEDTRVSYYDTLNRSSQHWHEGKHDLRPWLEYFLDVMLTRAYIEFERRVGLIQSGRGSKTAMVLDVIEHMADEFSVGDILERCPTVSLDLVRAILKQERKAGRLECLGRGPEAHWKKNR